MKKVSGTITIDFSALVDDSFDVDELVEYLRCYYGGAVPSGWLHDIEELEDEHTISNVVVKENEE